MNEIRNIRANTYPLTFSFLTHLQATDLSFVIITKALSNKIGEAFCEELK